MSHGIVSASHAPTVKSLWLVRDLLVVTINPIVLIASENCLPRDVPPVSNQLQVSLYLDWKAYWKAIFHVFFIIILGIGGTRFISFEDRHWHNDCFICATCKTSLVGRGFITDETDIICPECAKQKLM